MRDCGRSFWPRVPLIQMRPVGTSGETGSSSDVDDRDDDEHDLNQKQDASIKREKLNCIKAEAKKQQHDQDGDEHHSPLFGERTALNRG